MNRTNIEEANKHLQALYGRVSELERVIAEQHDALLSKDSFIQTKVKELSKQDSIILGLRQQLASQDQALLDASQRISILETNLKTSNAELECAQDKIEALVNIVHLIPELKSLVMRMEAISVSLNDCTPQFTNECNSATNSLSADGDNTDTIAIVTSRTEETIQMTPGSVSEMAKECNVQSERMKKFSISEDEEDEKEDGIIKSTTTLKEFYF